VLPDPRYAFERADIGDPSAVQRIMRQHDPDAIIHLAAESHVDRSIDGPRAFVDANVTGTFVLLEAARKHYEGLSTPRRTAFRFHHVSTDEVFGSLEDDDLFTETTPYAPRSPYAATKAASDMLVRVWHTTYGLPIVVSNSSNTYGPYQFPEKLIPSVILASLEGRDIPVYGDGCHTRDWLFVEDHARALLTVTQEGAIGESYNVGSRSEVRNIDLVQMICRTLDSLAPAGRGGSYAERIRLVADRPGHDRRYAMDPGKIERDLGWRPQVSLEDGIRRTVAWYLGNRWWLDAVNAGGFDPRRRGLGTSTKAKTS
jgi:dTDP-glucose 4,6-dehydratase